MLLFDPIYRGPIFGAMAICIASALVGVLLFVRKRTLVGEALSHATYPGVALAALVGTTFLSVLFGAALFSLLGFGLILLLERRFRLSHDAALCVVLAGFFGVGSLIASYAQSHSPTAWRSIGRYLYGQSATMTDGQMFFYLGFALLIAATIALFYKSLVLACFDETFARTTGKSLFALQVALVVAVVVVGVRSVGVLLMSAMLIAPPAAARQFSDNLAVIFPLAALFGLLSGLLGSYASLFFSLATGPMIVLFATSFALLSLLLAPKHGLLVRLLRIKIFSWRTMEENLLKMLWRQKEPVSKKQIQSYVPARFFYFLLWKRWLQKEGSGYQLSELGRRKGARIVRLHRLWETYMVNYLGVGAKRVHKSAEQMEHILTPELEEQLSTLMQDPTKDPHQQPIPTAREVHG